MAAGAFSQHDGGGFHNCCWVANLVKSYSRLFWVRNWAWCWLDLQQKHCSFSITFCWGFSSCALSSSILGGFYIDCFIVVGGLCRCVWNKMYILDKCMGSIHCLRWYQMLKCLAVVLHTSLHLRNMKNKLSHHMEEAGLKQRPMGVLLSSLGLCPILSQHPKLSQHDKGFQQGIADNYDSSSFVINSRLMRKSYLWKWWSLNSYLLVGLSLGPSLVCHFPASHS